MALNRTYFHARSRRVVALAAALAATGALLVAAPGAGPAEAADEPFPSNTPPGYSLAWADEFDGVNADGTGLDESEWFYREGEKAECSNQPDNVSVGDGLLHIALEAEQANGEQYTCGGVISNRWFGYGYYETRAKLWGDQGFHSAFWTTGLTAYIPDVPDYRGPHNRINEIDGFEVDSHAPDKLAYHSHWFVPEHVGNQGKLITQADSSLEYHNYGFEWTPTEVRFFTDGVLMNTLPKAGPHGIQNIWLTTLGYTAPVDETNLPGETTWDYFRYFAPVEGGADASAAQVVVDNGDPGYAESGAWAAELTDDRRVAFGFQDKEVRRSDAPGASASWTPNLVADGSYEVYVWNSNILQTGHSAARYTVAHDGGGTDVVLDQRKAGQQWVSLGVHDFTPGQGQGVSVVGDAAGSRRAARRRREVRAGGRGRQRRARVLRGRGVGGFGERHRVARRRHALRERLELDRAVDPRPRGCRQLRRVRLGAAARRELRGRELHGRLERSCGRVRGRRHHADRAMGATRQLRLRGRHRRLRRARQGLRRDGAHARRRRQVHRRRDPEVGAPSVPTGLEVDVERTPPIGDNWFTAKWEGVDDEDLVGYHVYLDGQRLTWQPVQRTTFDFHELLGGETYEIHVTAVDRLGNESEASDAVDAVVPRDKHAPDAPSGVVAEAANGKAVLYWDQNTELDLGGYNVYADGELITPEPFGNTNDAHNRDLGFEVPDLENGVAHTIEITTVDFVGNESKPTTVSVTPLPMAIIGVADAGYTEVGPWAPSSVAGWLASKTRTSNAGAASAEWRPDLPTAGTYEVWAWVPNNANSTPVARYTITAAGGTTVTELDQRSGGSRWVLLGTTEFDAGTSGAVTITNGASGYLRTNVVKFVPVG